mmetsp:Transcript_18295/g.46828  ORF Transcript_18295/g.46828 Transcript_18295/m.46828 type:complete len:565 (-) Transcript_18295:78-1772(-)
MRVAPSWSPGPRQASSPMLRARVLEGRELVGGYPRRGHPSPTPRSCVVGAPSPMSLRRSCTPSSPANGLVRSVRSGGLQATYPVRGQPMRSGSREGAPASGQRPAVDRSRVVHSRSPLRDAWRSTAASRIQPEMPQRVVERPGWERAARRDAEARPAPDTTTRGTRTSLLEHIQSVQQEIVRLQGERQKAQSKAVGPLVGRGQSPVPLPPSSNASPDRSRRKSDVVETKPAVPPLGNGQVLTRAVAGPAVVKPLDQSREPATVLGPVVPKRVPARHFAASRIQRAWRVYKWRVDFVFYSETQVGWVGALDWLKQHNLIYGTELADRCDVDWWELQHANAFSDKEVDPWGHHHMRDHLRRIWGEYEDEDETAEVTQASEVEPEATSISTSRQSSLPTQPRARAASLPHRSDGVRLQPPRQGAPVRTAATQRGSRGSVQSRGSSVASRQRDTSWGAPTTTRASSQGIPGPVAPAPFGSRRPARAVEMNGGATTTRSAVPVQGRVLSQSPARSGSAQPMLRPGQFAGPPGVPFGYVGIPLGTMGCGAPPPRASPVWSYSNMTGPPRR